MQVSRTLNFQAQTYYKLFCLDDLVIGFNRNGFARNRVGMIYKVKRILETGGAEMRRSGFA
jgi:hypothetical protein